MEEPEVASREEVEKWHEEDYWQKMDFSPTWIFIIPSAMIVCVLSVSYTHLTLPTIE